MICDRTLLFKKNTLKVQKHTLRQRYHGNQWDRKKVQ